MNCCSDVSLDVEMFCFSELDPEEPTCARVTLGGVMKFVQNRDVMAFAKRALFQRHPVMSDWPSSHGRLSIDFFNSH